MKSQQSLRLETEALIKAIWGLPAPAMAIPSPDPTRRTRQNAALAAAIRTYLQLYLAESIAEDQDVPPAGR